MTEEREDVVVLIDEEGGEVEFEHLDTIELNGNEYVVLLPLGEEEEEEEGTDEDQQADEVVILKIEHNEDGEDTFVNIEDDSELNAVFEEFKTHMEEEFDFSEE